MPHPSFAVRFRSLAAALMVLLTVHGGEALAISLMDPFNLPAAMDDGTAKVGDGIAYADGQRHKLDVYAPVERGKLAPVIFFIYGGGWNRGTRTDYEFVGHAFASRGFVTVIADYRLVPDIRYPDFLEDSANALRWVQDNIESYGGDPTRLYLAGHSAGAYNAVMLALDPSFLREYGVTMPIMAVAAISGPYDFYPFEYDEVIQAFGQAPNPQGTQPINLITSAAPPMYLATGTMDPIVRMQNTQHFAEALRAHGIWVTTSYFEGLGHMEPVIALGAMWRWRVPILDEITTFFTRFGAFPSGVPYFPVPPDPPEEEVDSMEAIVDDLDLIFGPLDQ